MRRLRGALPRHERARLSDLVEEALFGLEEVDAARTVLLFYSFGSEVGTGGTTERILSEGKRLLLPYLTGTGAMEAAELRPGDPLEPTAYGPREPASRVAVDPAEVDLVVVPGLAFDRYGHRLGYGGGHYDRFLSRMGIGAPRVGVAFAVQIVERLPVEPGDEPVDIVVTDRGTFRARLVQ